MAIPVRTSYSIKFFIQIPDREKLVQLVKSVKTDDEDRLIIIMKA